MKHLFTLLFLLFSMGFYAQNQPVPKEEVKLTELNKKQIIDSLAQQLEEFYIRPNAVGAIKRN